MGATVISPSSQKVQLFDFLLELTSLPSTQPYTTLLCLKTARAYLEAIAADPKRPSVAGLLRNPTSSFERLAILTGAESTSETQAATWQLLATILTTQRGCATAVIQEPESDDLAGVLKLAEDYILSTSETFTEEPHVVTAALAFVQAVLDCPSLDTSIVTLRKRQPFWEAVYAIANRLIPSPPTFQLSMHADDFASRIWQYAYSVQAKANATAVLSAELGLSVDHDEGRETKAQSLVLGLFRSPAKLTEAASSAVHSSCEPRVHKDQLGRLKECGWDLKGLETTALPAEREYGDTYLYGESCAGFVRSY
jgi:nuclear pore complex protein Nup188